jgi:hypothetical protein
MKQRKIRKFLYPLQIRIKEVLNTQPLLLQEPQKTTLREPKITLQADSKENRKIIEK